MNSVPILIKFRGNKKKQKNIENDNEFVIFNDFSMTTINIRMLSICIFKNATKS